MRTSRLLSSAGLVAGSVLLSSLVVGVGRAEWSILNPFGSPDGAQQSSAAPAPSFASQEQSIVEAVRAADPAVVSVIITKDLPKMRRTYREVPLEDRFPGLSDDFFGQMRLRVPQLEQDGTEKREVGGGTAFFVGDGLLLTNRHVVSDDEAEYTVLLNDGRKLPAKVVGKDATNDIAILKVEGTDFPSLAIAPDDQLFLGQTAIAIGNSLGEFRNTVSVGVVSGLQRSIVAGNASGGGAERLDEIIQTDAAINQGNSGGPLLDTHGRVIGMNTAVSAVGQNIGFALPAPELRRVLESYREHGRIVRTFLGVRYVPVTPELAEANKIDVDYGVLVARGETQDDLAVIPGSPADKAGIVENDIILTADGQKLTGDVSLQRIVQRKAPGDVLRLTIESKGKRKDVSVTLEEAKE